MNTRKDNRRNTEEDKNDDKVTAPHITHAAPRYHTCSFLRSLTVKKVCYTPNSETRVPALHLQRNEDERLLTAPTTGHPVSRRPQETRHHARGDDGARRSGLFDALLRWDLNFFDFVTVRARTETGGHPNPTTSASLSHRPAVLSLSQNASLVTWTMPSRRPSGRPLAVRPRRPSWSRRE